MEYSASIPPTIQQDTEQQQQPQPQTLAIDGAGGKNRTEHQISPLFSERHSPRGSPPGAFTNNSSMHSELEQIVLLDHCYDNQDVDENYQPENINRASLISHIRALRSSNLIQYRTPKRRKLESSKKRRPEEMEVDDPAEQSGEEVVIINRQKRVKKSTIGPRERDRGSHSDKRRRREKRLEQRQASLANQVPGLPETAT